MCAPVPTTQKNQTIPTNRKYLDSRQIWPVETVREFHTVFQYPKKFPSPNFFYLVILSVNRRFCYSLLQVLDVLIPFLVEMVVSVILIMIIMDPVKTVLSFQTLQWIVMGL